MIRKKKLFILLQNETICLYFLIECHKRLKVFYNLLFARTTDEISGICIVEGVEKSMSIYREISYI